MVNAPSDIPSRDNASAPNVASNVASGEAPEAPGAAPGKRLSPEARRALDEAEARRQAAPGVALPAEIGGRDGEEPTRYGDWERGGLAVDF